MPRCLLVVEQRFWVRGKGLLLSPGVVPLPGERVRVGDLVALVRPDGSTKEVMIRGTSTRSTDGPGLEVDLLLDLPGGAEVPIGTEVWSTGG
jgi:hypothetical protein